MSTGGKDNTYACQTLYKATSIIIFLIIIDTNLERMSHKYALHFAGISTQGTIAMYIPISSKTGSKTCMFTVRRLS